MKFVKSFLVISFLLASITYAQSPSIDPFPTPDILKDNVSFWKDIYTKYALSEGVVHDIEYPLVVYDRLTVGEEYSHAAKLQIEAAKARVVNALKNLASKPEAEWGDDERRYKAIYDAHAPDSTLAGAAERVRFQRGQRERFISGLERSGMYLDTIRSVLRANNVPEELAYLPHVESSFMWNAYSCVGAAGLWQFMRSTARAYMRVDYLVDERLDPIISTHAAAKYLVQSMQELQSWPIAITSYNYGINGMKHAEALCGSHDLVTLLNNYKDHHFDFASKNYYACFLACCEIAKAPEKYVGKVNYMPRLDCTTLVLTGYIKPRALAAYLKISEQTIAALNPSIRPVVFKQERQIPKGFVLRIPSSVTPEVIAAGIGSIPDSLKSTDPEQSKYYRIEAGDNLYGIAGKLGVSMQALMDENNLSSASRIYEGQVLNIPSTGVRAMRPAAVVTAVVAAATQPAKKTVKPVIAPAVAPPETIEPQADAAVAPKPLSGIPASWELCFSSDNLAATADSVVPEISCDQGSVMPPLPADSLKKAALTVAGASIETMKQGKPTAAPVFDVGIYGLESTLSASSDQAQIRVSVDETIGHYADWLAIPSARIRLLNGLRPNAAIRIGQRLALPVEGQGSLDRFAQARLEYHMALEEDFYSQYKVADVRKHDIRRGENLWDLCNGDDAIPLWLFKKYNKGADLTKLKPGVSVWIPVVVEKEVVSKP